MRISYLKTLLLLPCMLAVLDSATPQQMVTDSLRLRIVFPSNGDTLNFDRIRFAGSVLPGSKVWVQSQETKVYPTGAFVGMIDLKPGINEVVFISLDSMGALSDTVRVWRQPPVTTLSTVPTAIAPHLVAPASDVHLSAGDVLEVEFFGSPGGIGSFSIDDIGKNEHMIELPKRVRNGVSGWYKGTIVIPSHEDYEPKPVEFKFRGKDGEVLKFESRGKIHVLSPSIPLIGVTVDTVNSIQLKPHGESWMELPADVKLQITGEQNGSKVVRLAEDITAYISSKSVLPLPPGTPIPAAAVGNISTVEDSEWMQVRINLSERTPVKVNQMMEPPVLELMFYGSQMVRPWIAQPPNDETIRAIQWWQPTSEVFILRIDLSQPQQWGYKGRFVGNQYWLSIRKNPRLFANEELLLHGLTIAVDPGHGGESEGATSPTGLLEKSLNLRYATIVGDLLENAGARVIRTRVADTTLSLPERVKMAEDAGCHLFLSLHNNSIVPTSDPMLPRGSTIFYSVPHSQELAKSVFDRLVGIGLNPFGRIISTYFVTRQTSMLSILVEATFMSHPEDEMLLLTDGFFFDLARATVEGVKDLVRPLAEPPTPITETEGFLPTEPDTLR
jgi:N-acetylmuramoyl-L-alanine amidase